MSCEIATRDPLLFVLIEVSIVSTKSKTVLGKNETFDTSIAHETQIDSVVGRRCDVRVRGERRDGGRRSAGARVLGRRVERHGGGHAARARRAQAARCERGGDRGRARSAPTRRARNPLERRGGESRRARALDRARRAARHRRPRRALLRHGRAPLFARALRSYTWTIFGQRRFCSFALLLLQERESGFWTQGVKRSTIYICNRAERAAAAARSPEDASSRTSKSSTRARGPAWSGTQRYGYTCAFRFCRNLSLECHLEGLVFPQYPKIWPGSMECSGERTPRSDAATRAFRALKIVTYSLS